MANLLVLSAADVDAVTSQLEINDYVALTHAVFAPQSAPDRAESLCPPRITIPSSHHTALFMPARLEPPDVGGTAAKIVSVTDTIGLPATTLLFNEDGRLEAVVNARKLTALRNAAASLVSTQLLMPRAPATVVAFGAGEQIRAHLSLFCRAYPSINTCTIVARASSPHADPLVAHLSSAFPSVTFHKRTSPVDDVLESADIIICASTLR